ncbi:hypothetical protein [Bacillus gaemokensis]|uniref:Uncharacterized protein n=1 Tax=Bacillus gaemokensis TaxID=574375 RepID=A0A073K5F9_9BACI|nr:hypothetical protein [Bacillus gaemokensis]KEK21786.1 hypothetical protein BAGA_25045 [Bacillus gaemokensis]KYG33337.1 hypothetical protein AZF08_27160 [Bacillus gaemokensis]
MSEKKRDSFFWNLKKIENEEFFKWFESQGNIADSLYKLVCYFIDKHGLEDVADYKIQQQMQKEILLQDEDFLNDVKRILLNDSNLATKKENINFQQETEAHDKTATNIKRNSNPETKPTEKELLSKDEVLEEDYDDLDTANLFGN